MERAAAVVGHTFKIASFVVSAAFLCASPALASSLTMGLGTAADYTVVDLSSGKTLGQNAYVVQGNELLGNGVTAAFSGGNNGQITGTLYYDASVLGTNTFNQLQNPPTTNLVTGPGTFGPTNTTVTGAALYSANTFAAYAAGLAPTQTFGTINSTTTITGNGGLNVIDVGSISNAKLTLIGNANDIFIINVSGSFNTNQAMTLGGGVTASNVLFNFTGTSGHVLQTSGGDALYGTFLATDGGDFQFSELDLTGALINTDGNVQLVSGKETLTSIPFTPTTPLPAALPLFATGLGALGLLGWRRKRRPQVVA